MQLLSGYIYGSMSQSQGIVNADDFFVIPSVVEKLTVPGTKWDKLIFRSSVALTEDDSLQTRPYYDYEIFYKIESAFAYFGEEKDNS